MRTSWLCVIPVNAIWHCNQPGSCETVYHWFMAIESSPKHNGRAASLCNDSRKQLIKCRRFYSSKCDFKQKQHKQGRARKSCTETEAALCSITKLLLKTTTESPLLYCHISFDPPALPVTHYWRWSEFPHAGQQYQQTMALGKSYILGFPRAFLK